MSCVWGQPICNGTRQDVLTQFLDLVMNDILHGISGRQDVLRSAQLSKRHFAGHRLHFNLQSDCFYVQVGFIIHAKTA